MPARRPLGPLAIAALSTALGGCSFAFVNGPPPNHRTSPFFTCTSSNGVPMLDAVAATIALLDAASFATDSGSESSTTTGSKTGNAIVLGAGAALLAASAAYGYKKTSECREAEADLVRRTPVFTSAPGPFAPRGPYDPWVAHPAPAAAAAAGASGAAAAPPAAGTAAPGTPPAPSPPGAKASAPGSSPWDAESPGK
jgi:hypothetical protein